MFCYVLTEPFLDTYEASKFLLGKLLNSRQLDALITIYTKEACPFPLSNDVWNYMLPFVVFDDYTKFKGKLQTFHQLVNVVKGNQDKKLQPLWQTITIKRLFELINKEFTHILNKEEYRNLFLKYDERKYQELQQEFDSILNDSWMKQRLLFYLLMGFFLGFLGLF